MTKQYGAPGCDETAVNFSSFQNLKSLLYCFKHEKRLSSRKSGLEQPVRRTSFWWTLGKMIKTALLPLQQLAIWISFSEYMLCIIASIFHSSMLCCQTKQPAPSYNRLFTKLNDWCVYEYIDDCVFLVHTDNISHFSFFSVYNSHFVNFPLCQFPLHQFPLCQHWRNIGTDKDYNTIWQLYCIIYQTNAIKEADQWVEPNLSFHCVHTHTSNHNTPWLR